MYFFVYVIRCQKDETVRFYTGYCEELKNRIRQHIFKEVKTTKRFDKIALIYYEACLNKTDALRREKQLKTGFGRGYLKRRLESYLKLRD